MTANLREQEPLNFPSEFSKSPTPASAEGADHAVGWMGGLKWSLKFCRILIGEQVCRRLTIDKY